MVQRQLWYKYVQLRLTLRERCSTYVPSRLLKLIKFLPVWDPFTWISAWRRPNCILKLQADEFSKFPGPKLLSGNLSMTVSPWCSEKSEQPPFLAKEMGLEALFNVWLYGLKSQISSEQHEEGLVSRSLSSSTPLFLKKSSIIFNHQHKNASRNVHAFQHTKENFPTKWGHQKHRAEKSQMVLLFDFIFSMLIFSRWIGRLTSLTLLHHWLLLQLPLWMFFHKASPGTSEIDAW